MELLGNVASKALSLGSLREERERNISELTRRAFLLNALHEAALNFMEQTSKEDLLLQILDIFTEMAQAPRSLLVAWQPAAGGYVHFASKREGLLEKKRHLRRLSRGTPRRRTAGVLFPGRVETALRFHGSTRSLVGGRA
jgi:hypothetical protein